MMPWSKVRGQSQGGAGGRREAPKLGLRSKETLREEGGQWDGDMGGLEL